MTEQNHLQTLSDTISTRGGHQNLNAISAVVMGLALMWVAFCGILFWSNPPVSTEAALVYAGAALLPAAILGVCALMVQKFQISQQEVQRLHSAVEELRLSFIEQSKASAQSSLKASISRKLAEITDEQRKIHSLLSRLPSAQADGAGGRRAGRRGRRPASWPSPRSA